MEEKLRKFQRVTLEYNKDLIKMKKYRIGNNNKFSFNNKTQSQPKIRVFKTQGDSSSIKSPKFDTNDLQKRELIKSFYQQQTSEVAKLEKTNSGLSSNSQTHQFFLTRNENSSKVSLMLQGSTENKIESDQPIKLSPVTRVSCELKTIPLKIVKPAKINFQFSKNPAHVSFKQRESPVNKDIKAFRSSMVDFMSKIETFKNEKRVFEKRILPTMNRIKNINESSLNLLHRKLSNRESDPRF